MDIHLAQNALSLAGLFAMSVQDIKSKQISKILLYVYLFSGLINALITRNMFDCVVSAMPGIVLLILGFLTKQEIGYGDGLVVLGLGFWLGAGAAITILLIGSVFSSIVSLIYLAVHKIKGLCVKKTFPFVPFILLGLAVFVCYG